MELLRIFPTNVAISHIDEYESLNEELEKLPFLSNDLHGPTARNPIWNIRHLHPPIQKLYDHIMKAALEYADNYHVDQKFKEEYFSFVDGWAHTTHRDEGLFAHNHKLNHLVCVYYQNIVEGAGAIDFIDPRGTLGFISLDKSTSFNIFRVQPKSGDLLLWPGWLLHYVHPNKTDVPRKVIGANIKLNDDVQYTTPGISARELGTSIMKLN